MPKWFPKHRGLVVGIVTGAFAAGGFVFTPIQTAYINPDNIKADNKTRTFSDADLLSRVPTTFLIMAAVIAGFELIGIALIRDKPSLSKKQVTSASPQNTGLLSIMVLHMFHYNSIDNTVFLGQSEFHLTINVATMSFSVWNTSETIDSWWVSPWPGQLATLWVELYGA
ncbi:hypothetical protein PHET_07654 [Paragonimus heterotremus]|uniref:Uncharacterized protein n=1 Tax=Paragonimus heterotremus TaxID=100268 RepID=A0A8J4SVQ6_9TREM|nr:hypothetical protein PHET_07654 [Paragonimus heterotremus]